MHAGLECGVIGKSIRRYNGLNEVIFGTHWVELFWAFLKGLLERLWCLFGAGWQTAALSAPRAELMT